MSQNNMNQSKVGYPNELRQLADMIGGNVPDPNTPSLLKDAYWGGNSPSAETLFPYLQQWAPQLLDSAGLGGSALRGLSAQATENAYNQNSYMAGQAANLLMSPNYDWLGAANHYAQGIDSAVKGQNGAGGGSFGPSGLSERVANAALGAQANWKKDIYDRAISDARPQVRSAWSARGLGGGGASIRGESDTIQRITDDMTQRDVANRNQSLGVAAQAAGQAGQESSQWGQIGLGRGQLSLAASQMPGQVQGQFLANMLQGQQAQGGPMNALGTGNQLFQQGLQMPLQTFNNLYQTSRAPMTTGVNLLGGSAGTFNNPIGGKMGIPVRY